MRVITTNEACAEFCANLAQEPYIAVDTEFLRETTFWPKLCLIQLAGKDEAAVIDVQAQGLSLEPFFELMRNEKVIKVFHSARQDIEIIWYLGRLIPAPLFDTQIAASVLGFGEQVAYDQIVQQLTKAHIDKSHRFTDWSKRPLSDAQLKYALDDVIHLRPVYEALMEKLEHKNRTAWVKDDMAELSDVRLYEPEPENAWKRLKGRLRKPRDLAVLIEIAAWRERVALERNIPRGRVMKDDILLDIAMRPPRNPEELGALRSVPNGFERSKDAASLLDAVNKGLARDPTTLPEGALNQRKPVTNGAAATVELLKVLLKKVSEESGVAQKLLATTDELEELAREDNPDLHVLHGWRYELFGQHALKLKKGELALGVKNGRVISFSREL